MSSVRTRLRVVLVVVAAVTLASAGSAMARHVKSDPSVTVSPSGPYSFGETIYVTTDAPVYPDNTGPWIALACYQNGALVASGTHAGFSGGLGYTDPFILGPTQSWDGGPADCTVTVLHQVHNKDVIDAQTSFHVDG